MTMGSLRLQSKTLLFAGLLTTLFFFLLLILTWSRHQRDNHRTATDKNHTPDDNCSACHNSSSHMKSHGEAGAKCIQCHFPAQDKTKIRASSSVSQSRARVKLEGLIGKPGLLKNSEFTCGHCHKSETSGVKHSLMSSAAGLILTTRMAFGDKDRQFSRFNTPEITPSSLNPDVAPDHYMQDLCMECHLGNATVPVSPSLAGIYHENAAVFKIKSILQKKAKPFPGGCLACHLTGERGAHSDLTTEIGDQRCAGCHSGSGRISLSYAGYMEKFTDISSSDEGKNLLSYLRKFSSVEHSNEKYLRVEEDVHHKAGMQCVDCHDGNEVMGMSTSHAHKGDGTGVQCVSCHSSSLRRESVSKNGERAFIAGFQETRYEHQIEGDHKHLACITCHSQDVPQCTGCHLQYETGAEKSQNRWYEYRGSSSMGVAALGWHKEEIRPFLPAMVLSIDRDSFNKKRHSAEGPKTGTLTRHIFAPIAPHRTTSHTLRCTECHSNPGAMGWGSGKLKWDRNGKTSFTPSLASLSDEDPAHLPADAWMSPDGKAGGETLRSNSHPLSQSELKKVLRVGYCLQCHQGESEIFHHFSSSLQFKHSASETFY